MMDMASSCSDSESDIGSSDSEDHYDSESTYGGHAQNILSSLDQSIEKIDDFLAFGRVFTHGDVVCSVANPSGELGRVVDVDMTVNLETSSGELIKDINSKNLLRLLSFAPGDYVVYGPWLGRVSRVFNLVTILLNNGAKCEIMTRDPNVIMPVTPYVNEYAPYLHYPGQRVRINVPALSKSARWLCGSWKVSQDEGTVCHVEVGLVDVNWIVSSMTNQGPSASVPSHLQDPKKLTLLSGFPYANWQVGDWCTLPVSYFSELPLANKESPPLCFATQCLAKSQKELGLKDQICKEIYVIAKMKTKVDVVWQNGLLQTGIDSHTLSPVSHVSDHDFWPEQFVLERVISEDVVVTGRERLGIVKKVNAREQTVKVKWTIPDHEKVAACTGTSTEEIVSAYELIDHPDFSYSMGEIVFRFLPHLEHYEENLHHAQTNGEYQNKPAVDTLFFLGKDALKNHMHEDQDEYAVDYLSYIGNVIAFKDEGIIVKWASGLISKVHPSEIFGPDRLDNPSLTSMVGEVRNLESVANEIASQENQFWDEKVKVVNDSSDDFKSMWNSSSLTVPKAVSTFLTNVASTLFGSFGSTSQSGSTEPTDLHCLQRLDLRIPTLDPTINMCSVQAEDNCKIHIIKTKEMESGADDPLPEVLKHKGGVKGADDPLSEVLKHKGGVKDADGSLPEVLKHKGGATQDEQNALSPGNKKREQFKRFDIVEDYSGHHFENSISKGLVLPLVRRDWVKKIQQEWSILKNNLPDGIYVRVYEERIDLLRATIIGADGTPYHNGLFFFDILFPPDYPREPPMVHYNSGGLRLNPNLYESGKVCLSLLKTWTGTGTEVWNPEKSTVLQVLLSLQALVLNDKPYFNEAGYDKQVGRAEGERNSVNYNENAFLVTCRTMLYHLRKPPKHFEALVEDHFAQKAHSILLACKTYMDGTQVGYAFNGGSEGQRSSSTGFKIMLGKLYPKLVSSFSEKGIDCSQFIEQVNPQPYTGKDLDLT